METGESSKGDGSGEDSASDVEDEDDEDEDPDDEEEEKDEEEEAGSAAAPAPEFASVAGWAATPALEPPLRAASCCSWLARSSSRSTRSSWRVKCVTAIGACRSPGASGRSCSASPVHDGIAGDSAGRAERAAEVESGG